MLYNFIHQMSMMYHQKLFSFPQCKFSSCFLIMYSSYLYIVLIFEMYLLLICVMVSMSHFPQHTYTSQRTLWNWLSPSIFRCSFNFIYVAMINNVIKGNLERKGLFGSQFQFIAHHYEFKTGT